MKLPRSFSCFFYLLGMLLFCVVATTNAQTTFTPQEYSPALWLDGADINADGSISSNSTPIDEWKDKSGNNYHALPPSATQRPVYFDGGVRFDGAGDFLSTVDLDYGANEEFTIVVMVTIDTANWIDGNLDGQGWIVSKNSLTSSAPYGIHVQKNSARIAGVRTGAQMWFYSDPLEKTIFSQTISGEDVLNLKDSNMLRRKTGSSNNNAALGIGSGNNSGFRSFKGTVFEVLVFQYALSRCQLNNLEGYLAHKWNNTARLPDDHYFKNQPFGNCGHQSFTIPENSPNGTVVGSATGINFETNNPTISFQIADNTIAANAFQIDPNTGQISVKDGSLLDYESYGAFSLNISILRNGVLSTPSPLMIRLADVAEPGSPPVHSLLWGVNGELWNPRGRLPDFSYAGYHSGELTLPNPVATINVANLGVIPDDGLDDQPLIQQIIDNNNNAVLFFPAGVYELHRAININKSNIVLKGNSEQATGTVFYVPFSASVYEGGYIPNFSFGHDGNIFSFKGGNSSTNYPIIEPCKRGDKTLTVQNAQQYFSAGELIGVRWTDENLYGSFWEHIHNNQTDGWTTNNPCSWGGADDTKYFTVERVENHLVTLKEPLPLDIDLNWIPTIFKTEHIQEVGIRDIRIEFNSPTAAPHLSEPGYNGIGFFNVKNGWINNVTIVNSDNALQIGKGAVYCTAKDITVTGRKGHHAIYITDSEFNLLEGTIINVDNTNDPWLHGVSLDHGGHGNVVSRTSGNSLIRMDFHKDSPFENLITNTQSEWNHDSSGSPCAGPNAAARNTWWNNYGTSYEPHDGYGNEFGHIQSNVVGDLGMNVRYTEDREWYEHRVNVEPTNLYEGQLNYRINQTPPTIFTPDPIAGNRDNYQERDPSKWKIALDENNNFVYQLTTTDIPYLTDFKLGAYSILNAPGETCIEANVQSFEDMTSNPSGDIALVLNYTDDQNYDYALITNSPANNGIYRLQNGIKQMVAVAPIAVTLDNNKHQMAFRYVSNHYELLYDDTIICTYPVGNINNLGKPGIGTVNDQAAFDDISLTCGGVEPIVSLWLEGAYDANTNLMTTRLLQIDLLPTLHPYTVAPWNYPGTEGQGWTTNDYPSNAVDWVKVSFRNTINKNSEVAATVAVLLNDGKLFFLDERVVNSSMGTAFYVVVEHRNHIGAMSANPVPIIDNKITYDFRSSNSYVLGVGQKEIATGVWALYGGDGDQLSIPAGFDINGQDNTFWNPNNGLFDDYLEWDYNLDGDVNGADKILWMINNGTFSSLER